VTISRDGLRILPRLLEVLRLGGITVTGINMKKPSMDDVFMHHTGREIRDEGPESAGAVRSRRR